MVSQATAQVRTETTVEQEEEKKIVYNKDLFFTHMIVAARPISGREAEENLEKKLLDEVNIAVSERVIEENSDFIAYFCEHIENYVSQVHESEQNLWRLHNDFIIDLRKLVELLPKREEIQKIATAA